MELLEGEPLSEQLKRGPLTVHQAVPAAVDILDALGAIHAGAIVHRDLKPSNVFMARHRIKLLDFGLARPELTMAVDSMAGLTHAGAVLGTTRLHGARADHGRLGRRRTDVFAVGAILFEMLAGRPAFTGRTITALLNATLTEQPPALAARRTWRRSTG